MALQRGLRAIGAKSGVWRTPAPKAVTSQVNSSLARRHLSSNSSKEAQTEASKKSTAADDVASTKRESKITWIRGYLGAHSNTDPPDAMFLGVAAIVAGAGFYAWFIEPPERSK